MTPSSKAKDSAPAVRVVRYTGRETDVARLYQPLPADLLVTSRPLPFDVYQRSKDEYLEMLISAGAAAPLSLRNQLKRAGARTKRFYVSLDQKDAFLRFEEEAIPEILADEEIPVSAKCNVLLNLTTHLSQELFEKPNALAIQRQRENVSRLVDFTLREPAALRSLLTLTHHDYQTYTHSVNVGLYALTIASEHFERIGKRRHSLTEVVVGFFLHDIGKSQIPSHIINKNGPLTQEEWVEMRNHPVYGYRILESEKALSPEVVVVVLQHHERISGDGYPHCLCGDKVHLYARICAVADAYDALTSHRSYKPTFTPYRALSIMKHHVNTQFDPEVFATLVRLMERKSGRL